MDMKTNAFLLAIVCLFLFAACAEEGMESGVSLNAESESAVQVEADYVQLEKAEYDVETYGGTIEIKFTTNLTGDLDVMIVTDSPWLAQEGEITSTGDGWYTFTLKASSNQTHAARTAHIYFTKEAGREREVLEIVALTQETDESNSPDGE